MRIAVATTDLKVSNVFEQSSDYTIYTVNRGIITDCQNTPNPGPPYSNTLNLFREIGVDVLIVGRINIEIAEMCCASDIEVVAGASGDAKTVVEQYLTNTLIGVDEVCHDEDDI